MNRKLSYRLFVMCCYTVGPVLAVFLSQLVFPWKPPLLVSCMRWFSFFGIGWRLFPLGVYQAIMPRYLAREMYRATDYAVPVVMQLGFANGCIGLLGLLSPFFPGFLVPAMVAGGLYHGLAGLMHVRRWHQSAEERMLTISDLCFFVLTGVLFLLRYLGY